MRARLVAASLAVLVVVVPEAPARDREIHHDFDRQKIRNYNVVLTPVFSLISAAVQGHVKNWRDVRWQLGVGTAAGASYYQAKRMIGDGHATAGWLLTNATASAVENVTSGERLHGRFGYTVGPVRFRFATPYAKTAIARIEMDGSLYETGALIYARYKADGLRFRNGMIVTEKRTCWPNPDVKNGCFYGMTFGVFPGTAPIPRPFHETASTLWHHEMVHAAQQQQIDSVEPAAYKFGGEPSKPLRLFAVRNVRAGLTHALDLPNLKRPYVERWWEVEAYALAERTPVDDPSKFATGSH